MTEIFRATASRDGLTVTAHRGDGSVLLAFDLAEDLTEHLAGFAIVAHDPGARNPRPLLNRLSFDAPVTAATPIATRRFTSTVDAPVQKFRWIDFPKPVVAGRYRYTVTARRFDPDAQGIALVDGPSVDVELDVVSPAPAGFELAFTSGFLGSQAYATRFKNRPIRPKGTARQGLDADVRGFENRWNWLGGHARAVIYRILAEVRDDPALRLDVLAYDLDEPRIVAGLVALGPRVRLVLDDSAAHTGPTDAEPEAHRRIEAAGGQVKRCHLARFQHHKVLIVRRGDEIVKVLAGSANFSIRGLYAQANNVVVFANAQPCALYGEAFDLLWQGDGRAPGFRSSELASKGWLLDEQRLPGSTVSFAPHASEHLSLDDVAGAIDGADDSVLFAVMDLDGGGEVLARLRGAAGHDQFFSYGVADSAGGISLYKPGSSRGVLVPSAVLRAQIPAPFQPFLAETTGGVGHTIHHKFVVVDFNTSDPVVFAGSSNLVASGERNNGDSLFAIRDRAIATAYAIEAVRLVDHYHFRASVKAATTVRPLVLQGRAHPRPWWRPYYRAGDLKAVDRRLFVR
jgi:hypothetical protein